jgi:hypothetical protein
MSAFSPTAAARIALGFFTPVAVALTIYLYLYPVFSNCGFPLPPSPSVPQTDSRAAFVETARLHVPEVVGYLEGKLNRGETPATQPRQLAPFRLLALGDPQLEGDTSIPDVYAGFFPHTRDFFKHITFLSSHYSFRQRVRWVFHDFIDILFEDIFNSLESVRKRIDLFGNDFYLAHIYRTLHWWAKPTHITVLGDLVGSQWLPDDEFERRGVRYWKRVFKDTERVPDDVAREPASEYELTGFIGAGVPGDNDTDVWTRRVINVAGNHDIGYAGDITGERMERFERIFGKANYELRFELSLSDLKSTADLPDQNEDPTSDKLTPELRIVILNDMNLDTPASSINIQDETYGFINKVINTAAAVEYKGHFTIVLTHVPLYKPEGICVDKPFFAFHDHDGTLKEQNQLSADASKGFLEGIFGMSGNMDAPGHGRGRRGLILNGHDHAGCDTYHFINQTEVQAFEPADDSLIDQSTEPLDGASDDQPRWPSDRTPGWQVRRWEHVREFPLVEQLEVPGMREITVRSMMGDFGGNAGLLSVWFDESSWEWQYEFATCPLGRQHLWWAVHILDFFIIIAAVVYLVLVLLTASGIDADGWLVRNGRVLSMWTLTYGARLARNTRLGRWILAQIQKAPVSELARQNGTRLSAEGQAGKSQISMARDLTVAEQKKQAST